MLKAIIFISIPTPIKPKKIEMRKEFSNIWEDIKKL